MLSWPGFETRVAWRFLREPGGQRAEHLAPLAVRRPDLDDQHAGDDGEDV